jgi:hypothetical protein
MSYRHILALLGAMIIGLFPSILRAAPPEGGQDYIVQDDDWLSKLAEKFYGDQLAYSVIVEATNAKAATDQNYTPIENPDLIEVGQRLFIPVAEALATIPEEQAMQQAVTITQTEPTPEQLQLLAGLSNQGAPPELF